MAENKQNQTQVQKLQALKKQQETAGSMTSFAAAAIDVGIEPREHFPNLKDASGKTLKDERGYAKKSETSDGWAHTLAVFGKKQFVEVVLPKKLDLMPAHAYYITGFGYDMRENFYIRRDPKIKNY